MRDIYTTPNRAIRQPADIGLNPLKHFLQTEQVGELRRSLIRSAKDFFQYVQVYQEENLQKILCKNSGVTATERTCLIDRVPIP